MALKKNKIVLLRHGESEWNLENRFTGWTNVNLTKTGEEEAEKAGALLQKEGFNFDLVYTSVLKRAIDTLKICLKKMNIKEIPINYEWRLNERHYGALQGLNKSETAKKYGNQQVYTWRRSYDIPPPPLKPDDERHPKFDLKYKNLLDEKLPKGESLKNTLDRVMPLWEKNIVPKIVSGQKVLIVAHGNSLRAIIKILDKISNKNIMKINIPTGIPLIYKVNKNLKPINNYYLSTPNELQKKLDNVIRQGRKSN